MEIRRLEVGPMQANCYLIFDAKQKEAAVIDPGGEYERILEVLEEYDLILDSCLLTHAHIDHMAAYPELAARTGVRLIVHEQDAELLRDPRQNLSELIAPGEAVRLSADTEIRDGDRVEVGCLSFMCHHTPGHTPGSIVIEIEENLFTGDLLFAGSIGRTDLFGGSREQMSASLDGLKKFRGGYSVYPGHGPITTMQEEREKNPFLNGV